MYEMFETVLFLSIFGFCVTAVLLLLKPVTSKKFSAKWQYYAWIAVLLIMIIPFYKFIPQKQIQKIPLAQNQTIQEEINTVGETDTEAVIIQDTPIEYREIEITPKFQIRLLDLLTYIWAFGVLTYLTVVIVSYAIYKAKKRRNTVTVTENSLLEAVKRELKIKRRVKVRLSEDILSPMLVGVLFPTIYIPCREISDEKMRMVFLHELTHYKRGDLIVKWFGVFVNALHWFNPLCYLLCANLSEACEVSCDMAVTRNMNEEEQKLYMETILDITERG